MPGKVNPVMHELINQVAFQVIGNDHTNCLASEARQLELNVMEPVLVFNLIQSLSIMNNAFCVLPVTVWKESRPIKKSLSMTWKEALTSSRRLILTWAMSLSHELPGKSLS
jgi:aspartate ammonia-lyase